MVIDTRRNLIEYFKKNLKKGYTVHSLKWSLINQGYSRAAVDAAAQKAQEEMAVKAPVLKEKPIIKYNIIDEKDNEIPVKLKKPWWKVLIDAFKFD